MTPEMSGDRPAKTARGVIGAEARARLLGATPFGGLGAGVANVVPLLVEKRLDRGAVLIEEGQSGTAFFVLAVGRVRVFRTLPDGREITVFLLQAGASFGFLPLLDGRPLPVSVGRDGAVYGPSSSTERTSRGSFAPSRRSPSVSSSTFPRGSGSCMDQLGMLGQAGALARAAHGLLSLVPEGAPRKGEATVTLPSSQEELARVLHVSPENLSRALRKLRERGLLERLGPRRFRIPSLDALRRIGNGA